MSNTAKVKSAGRYGARYGVGIRKKLLKIESKQRKYYACPFCGAERVRRKAPGIYSCRKCDNTFAGGAYLPSTLSGSIVQKMVAQRSFLPSMKQLLAAKEEGLEEQREGDESEAAEGKHGWRERPRRRVWREHGRPRRDFFGRGKDFKEHKGEGERGKEIHKPQNGKDEHKEEAKVEHKGKEEHTGESKKGHEIKGKHKEEARGKQKGKESSKEKKEGKKK